MKSIMLFSNDLRLDDNLALHNACQKGDIIPVYIFDKSLINQGENSKFWLKNALNNLNKSLNDNVLFFKGDLSVELLKIAKELNVNEIYFNKNFEPEQLKAFSKLKNKLTEHKINFHEYNSHLLFDLEELLKSDGSFYKVYTPFYNNAMIKKELIRLPVSAPKITYSKHNIKGLNLEKIFPLNNNKGKDWDISEKGAKILLKNFLSEKIKNYAEKRDFMSEDVTSKLSPYLHFGQISVSRVYNDVVSLNLEDKTNIISFVRELMFREFSYYLLYFFPELPNKNFNEKFDDIKWKGTKSQLEKWQQGQTGIPIIDAGMRELQKTGFMHNRVRMIVGSFLVKNLLIDWQEGKKWFEDNLFDANLAANSFSWQWVAGSGVDAAPFFRIFNPITQSKKFDSEGEYIRRFVPELADIDNKYIHEPCLMPDFKKLNYPNPMVELTLTRVRALNMYKKLKKV